MRSCDDCTADSFSVSLPSIPPCKAPLQSAEPGAYSVANETGVAGGGVPVHTMPGGFLNLWPGHSVAEFPFGLSA